jgi:hypothetical protein
VQAEAVNAVIDVYGAHPNGAAGFSKTGLLTALQSMLPAFKQKVRNTFDYFCTSCCVARWSCAVLRCCISQQSAVGVYITSYSKAETSETR